MKIKLSFTLPLIILLSACSNNLGSSLGKRPQDRGLSAQNSRSAELVGVNSMYVQPVACSGLGCPDPAIMKSLSNDLAEAFNSELTLEVSADQGKPADTRLETLFYEYQERQGSAIGATKPAVVDFSMRLIRNSDGKEIWNAIYHFKDQDLTENLLKADNRINDSGQMGWKSARQIAKAAFSAAAKTLDAKRTVQFTGGVR
jgi:hypothetical protein